MSTVDVSESSFSVIYLCSLWFFRAVPSSWRKVSLFNMISKRLRVSKFNTKHTRKNPFSRCFFHLGTFQTLSLSTMRSRQVFPSASSTTITLYILISVYSHWPISLVRFTLRGCQRNAVSYFSLIIFSVLLYKKII